MQELFILGHPVAHSKSPVMYNALYEALGLPWRYGFADEPDTAAADAFLAARDFLSVNVTTPYKPNAAAAADIMGASAKLAHGVNLLVNTGKVGKVGKVGAPGQDAVAARDASAAAPPAPASESSAPAIQTTGDEYFCADAALDSAAKPAAQNYTSPARGASASKAPSHLAPPAAAPLPPGREAVAARDAPAAAPLPPGREAVAARDASAAAPTPTFPASLLGFNVDGDGAVRYLERAGVQIAGAQVVVCGTGPTAAAIMHSCVQAGAARVCMLGRSRDRAAARVNTYLAEYAELLAGAVALPSPHGGWLDFATAYERANVAFGAYETSSRAIAEADVIVDATPLGMASGDPAPFDPAIFAAPASAAGKTFFDTVYGHGTTAFCALGAAAGARVLDGAGMLVSQAALTAAIVCEVAHADAAFTYEEAFKTMAAAAGFNLP